ncbi:DNA repair protein dds20 mei5 [Phlyctema vagabunda]|uniref:DNA repair protein dds20 mei5 n=1 Tax=Phlyctema vagabunda TaxID=108571 RepID=A0ABR4PJJ6_9HELO
MLTPAAKRRRIDTASQTLSKPFRSPFKPPLKPANEGASSHLSTPLKKVSRPSTATSSSTATSVAALRTPRSTGARQKTRISNDDPDIAPLLKQQRELEKELRAVKQEMEVVEQAGKIEVKCGPEDEIDAELKELVVKWKAASRLAAEEMFGGVRDRVNRMGGPRAWKEMQQKQVEFREGWDREEVPQNGGGGDSDEDEDEEKRDLYAEYGDVEMETENEKAARGDTGEDPGQEDEFTMAMMLRTLNVDLKIIGYDREEQRWVD